MGLDLNETSRTPLAVGKVNGMSGATLGGIDLGKFIAAVLVVLIHTHPLKWFSVDLEYYSVQGIARLAVPFFFVCSGYLYARSALKKNWAWSTLGGYLKRLLIVYGVWSLVYLPLYILQVDEAREEATARDKRLKVEPATQKNPVLQTTQPADTIEPLGNATLEQAGNQASASQPGEKKTAKAKSIKPQAKPKPNPLGEGPLNQVLLTLYRFCFSGLYYHFWFFPSLISSVVLLHLVFRRLPPVAIICLGLALYAICLAGDSYGKLSIPVFGRAAHYWASYFSRSKNLVMSGFIYVAMGGLLASRDARSPVMKNLMLSALFMITHLLECYFVRKYDVAKYHNMTLSLVPAAYFAFVAAVNWRPSFPADTTLARNLSIVVYFIHPLVRYLIMETKLVGSSNPMFFFVVLAISSAAGYLIVKSKARFFKLFY